jgi:hypothetical protein
LNEAINVAEFIKKYKQFQTQTKLNARTILIHYRKLMSREHNRTQQNTSDGAENDGLSKTAPRYKPNDYANYSYEDVICLSPMGRNEWEKMKRDGSKVCSLLSNSSQISPTHCCTLHFLRYTVTPTPRKCYTDNMHSETAYR